MSSSVKQWLQLPQYLLNHFYWIWSAVLFVPETVSAREMEAWWGLHVYYLSHECCWYSGWLLLQGNQCAKVVCDRKLVVWEVLLPSPTLICRTKAGTIHEISVQRVRGGGGCKAIDWPYTENNQGPLALKVVFYYGLKTVLIVIGSGCKRLESLDWLPTK